jgi:hypothetical protein
VLIFFDRKRFESPLVKMACSLGMVTSMPAHGVGVSHPSKKLEASKKLLEVENWSPEGDDVAFRNFQL